MATKTESESSYKNPFESFKKPTFFYCTRYSILLHRKKLQVLKQPLEGVL
jgi:hypothetical protein